jgi:hypothetical protein
MEDNVAKRFQDACYLASAREGYAAPANAQSPHYYSSSLDMAWRVGRWLKETGRSESAIVQQARGYKMRVNDMIVRVDYKGKGQAIVERIA